MQFYLPSLSRLAFSLCVFYCLLSRFSFTLPAMFVAHNGQQLSVTMGSSYCFELQKKNVFLLCQICTLTRTSYFVLVMKMSTACTFFAKIVSEKL